MIHRHNSMSIAAALRLIVLSLAGFVSVTSAQVQNWGNANPSGPIPAARSGHGMVYDSAHNKVILFGGQDGQGQYLNDVWEWNTATTTWTNVTPILGPAPEPRSAFGMTYDPIRNKVVVYGGNVVRVQCCGWYDNFGFIGDTWEWDTISKSWEYKPADSLGYIGRAGSRMAFDPTRNQVVLFSGQLYFTYGDPLTYAWDGTNWIDITPANSPRGRFSHSMVTDTARSKIVMFGGRSDFGELLQDTWEWNGSTWTQILPSTQPFSRADAVLSYDSMRQVSVFFGGFNGYTHGFFGDTWEWNGQSWLQQQPCDSPARRRNFAMVYDPVARKHILFGGTLSSGAASNETFLYGTGQGIPPCGDATAPTTTANSTSPNSAGWNNSDVVVTLSAADDVDGSGIKDINYTAVGAHPINQTIVNGSSATFTISGEGETTISYFSTDIAGNTETAQTLLIRIDKTAPSVSCDGSDGSWHAVDVSLPCSANDSASGLSNSSDGSFSLTTSVPSNTETESATTNSRTVCDAAGNCATAGPISGNKIDKKAPMITITTPSLSAAYPLNQAVAANYTCNDSGSGVGSCAGPVANGSNTDTASAGSKTFTVNASDQVGNTTTQSGSYSIDYGVVALYDQSKVHKSGSTVPVRIQIVDANGVNQSSASLLPHAVSVVLVSSNSSGTPEDSGNSNPDLNFRYDASLGGYIFNLKTTGYSAGTYELHFVVAGDTSDHVVQFRIRL